ncbi:hypothetical protein Pla52o_18990 [Novipirellula galeiformis]|uniref:Uncharacterized protein n=1 Tax=Novipirellula galeiformis TaxID=2528004 RepID=A0A5C6CLF9_9BACT|nr:hypothetical protein Pla52o_18990 [Novipirellula galeiformis]
MNMRGIGSISLDLERDPPRSTMVSVVATVKLCRASTASPLSLLTHATTRCSVPVVKDACPRCPHKMLCPRWPRWPRCPRLALSPLAILGAGTDDRLSRTRRDGGESW